MSREKVGKNRDKIARATELSTEDPRKKVKEKAKAADRARARGRPGSKRVLLHVGQDWQYEKRTDCQYKREKAKSSSPNRGRFPGLVQSST